MESQIKESLIVLLNAISRSDGSAVSREMVRLDGILAREKDCLPAQLAHFLERRSYAKALTFLGGESPPAGACGGRDSSPRKDERKA